MIGLNINRCGLVYLRRTSSTYVTCGTRKHQLLQSCVKRRCTNLKYINTNSVAKQLGDHNNTWNASKKIEDHAVSGLYGNASAFHTHGSSNGAKGNWFLLMRHGGKRAVEIWLLASAGMTAGVMAMGAYVRLRESGLSMLDWHLLGKYLPKDEEEWMEEFNKYKTTPEYQQVHFGIDLDDYKNIFINEWLHRMMGRTSGLFFGAGALYLALRRQLGPGGYFITLVVSALGLGQAFVGKWMVDSGFKELQTENRTPRVSPYRLCIHFSNALAIYSICFWNGFKNIKSQPLLAPAPALLKVRRMAMITLSSMFCTMVYGTLVAGNDAGLAYNTWPKMMDTFIPNDYAEVNSAKHLFEKTGVIQFNHRCLGYITFLMSLATYYKAKSPGVPRAVRSLAMGVTHAAVLQIVIGVITVLKTVPLHGAMAHHTNAMVLWSMLLMLLVRLR
uniref:Cytochrome c oxidase assembly protein, putative n=1 Tax=Babesia bovis TaxID=5865 RepID=S6B7E6_BABBO|nr:cytochrome c oxidase assembly protein, putative [Babesia bovis]